MQAMSTDQRSGVHDPQRDSAATPANRTEDVAVAANSSLRQWTILAEAFVSVALALLAVLLARSIEVSPLDRVGQVSGLAGLQLRFALVAMVLVIAVIACTAGRRERWKVLTVHLVSAGIAGLGTGLVAGAVVIALRGTSWGLNGPNGDAGTLVSWARAFLETGSTPENYPPAFIHALAWYTELSGGTPEHSLKVLQIVLTALFGPAVYLAWRLLLSPTWALGVGVVTALPLIDPYKPYTNVMLAVLIPVLLLLVRQLRRSGGMPWRRLLLSGAGFGVAIGAIFLVYSGWFVWSAPGLFAAALLVFPWRTGWSRGLTLIIVTSAVFVLVAHRHLFWLLMAPSTARDRYYFFDTWAEPAYIAMWRGDLPGANPGPWPPPGELGGVGLFTILLLVGFAMAIAVGLRRTIVLALTCIFAGAWLLRFHFGSQMYANDAVQFYPRSTVELVYCLLLLTGFAVYYAARSVATSSSAGWFRSAFTTGSVRTGALVAVVLLIAASVSATGDRYMPRTDNSAGMLAFNAQVSRQVDGRCSAYTATWGYGCLDPGGDPRYGELIRQLNAGAPRPGELPHRVP